MIAGKESSFGSLQLRASLPRPPQPSRLARSPRNLCIALYPHFERSYPVSSFHLQQSRFLSTFNRPWFSRVASSSHPRRSPQCFLLRTLRTKSAHLSGPLFLFESAPRSRNRTVAVVVSGEDWGWGSSEKNATIQPRSAGKTFGGQDLELYMLLYNSQFHWRLPIAGSHLTGSVIGFGFATCWTGLRTAHLCTGYSLLCCSLMR